MKSFINYLLRPCLATALLLVTGAVGATNTIETVTQVSGHITLSQNVDYVVTSATPFVGDATVNINHTDQAVLILKGVRPEAALGLLSHVKINGKAAVNKNNCMVKIYQDGSIILPYGTAIQPLAVYGADNTLLGSYAVGLRQPLKGTAANNAITRFTLKRGYMVCLATRNDGTGYSRIYIADKADIDITLPAILLKSVSSLRVSQWNDTSKKGYAGNDVTANSLLNTTWCYNWDAGVNVWNNREYVTQHHHEGWPGIADVGNNGTSACILGNNEPDNKNDAREHPATVDEVLATWPQMMATGRRLGSPAMSGNLNWLYSFIDSIDARGWRCDYVVMHCYWLSDWPSWRNALQYVHNRTKRPIWITEMNYGANWTGWPGSDRSGSEANYAIEKQHFAPTIDGLESTPWLERYAVYNWVQDCRKVYDNGNGTLTPMGQYYASKASNMAYNSLYDYVPALPKPTGKPDHFAVNYSAADGRAVLTWHEYDGEYNGSMTVERKANDGVWTKLADISLQEEGADYTYTDATAVDGYRYRIHLVNLEGKDVYSAEVTAAPTTWQAGDAVNVDGTKYYMGGNVLTNGDFDMGVTGFTNGQGESLAAPHFEVMPCGGIDNGTYLQAYSHQGVSGAGSFKALLPVEPNSRYYFSVALRQSQNITYNRLSLTTDGTTENEVVAALGASPEWNRQVFSFSTNTYRQALLSCRWLDAKAQFDKLVLARLFTSRAEAIADGIVAARRQAAAIVAYNTQNAYLNAPFQQHIADVTGNNEAALHELLQENGNMLKALKSLPVLDSLLTVARSVADYHMPTYTALATAMQQAEHPHEAADVLTAVIAMRQALANYLSLTERAGVIASPNFASASGWTVKAGTHKAGDQRLGTVDGTTCWNAWWSGISSTEGTAKSMAVSQRLAGLQHGLYALTCKAATQHYCLSDQHAYISVGEKQAVSPSLAIDGMDLPTMPTWQTLTTVPLYVGDNDSLTIGFIGTKKGAQNHAWKAYGNTSDTGDLREGWWCATDFSLLYHPIYHRDSIPSSGWDVVCLPYDIVPPEGTHIYSVVGYTADKKHLCLAEESMGQAGMPYVIHTDKSDLWLFEQGEAISNPSNSNGLRGVFKTNARPILGSYVLVNGVWKQMKAKNRDKLLDYTAFLCNFTGLTRYETGDFTGIMMPIDGEITDGIGLPTLSPDDDAAVEYTVGGIRQHGGKGVVIRVKGGKSVKVLQ